MVARRLITAVVAVLVLVPPLHGRTAAAATLELYGTFHAMGVTVDLDAADDPDGDATATLQWRPAGTPTWHDGYPPLRVAPQRFVGSLFWLQPGDQVEVRVSFTDPDGDPLDGVVLSASASARDALVLPTPSVSLHASPSGTGTACTVAEPCALATALGLAQPGEEVVLAGGTYFVGELSLPRSGTAGAPIVIRAAAGETPVLDGADPATFAWTSEGGGVYRTTVNVADTHLVTAAGSRLYPYQTLADLESLAWGIPGFFVDGTTLRVRLAGDADPNGVPMVVSRFNHAFFVGVDHIWIQGLTFRHYGQGSWAKAVYLDGADDTVITGCTFTVNDLGVGIKRDAHRNVIQDCEFSDTIFDWPWDAVKSGAALETGGVRMYSPMTGRGTVIRRNTFHDFFDGFGACPGTGGTGTNETDVYANLVYRVGDDGMETDGHCSNVRIWGNTFHDVLMGISLAPAWVGPTWAIRNLIHRTGVGNNDYTGSPFKFNSGYDTSGPMLLFHNTADAALPGNHGLYIKAPGTWTALVGRNNIWSGTDHAIYNYNEAQPADLDWDDLFTTRPDRFVYWGVRMDDLATFRAQTGRELHGLDVDPAFRDPAAGNYVLDPSSPLVDAGVVIPGINDAYRGAGPDIGAFESTCVFDDVPPGHWALPWITELCEAGITAGCSADPPLYCPGATTLRGQMAVFLLASLEGSEYTPPDPAGIFDDVPVSDLFAPWIEELAGRGITAGCSSDPPLYCPGDPVTRQQMAVFLLASLEGSEYTPPAPTGVFDDVPVSDPFAPWIEELAGRGITAGCSTDPPLYCPTDSVTRDQMAVFLSATFGPWTVAPLPASPAGGPSGKETSP